MSIEFFPRVDPKPWIKKWIENPFQDYYADHEIGIIEYQKQGKKMSFNVTRFLWDQLKIVSGYLRGHSGEVDRGYDSMCKLENHGVIDEAVGKDEANEILINPPKVDIEPILVKYRGEMEAFLNRFREEMKALIIDEVAKASNINFTNYTENIPVPIPIEQTPTPPPVPRETPKIPLPDEITEDNIDVLLEKYKRKLAEKADH